jgi:hypothetical protein
MFTNEKTGKTAKNSQKINIKLALIYFLLVIFFISLLLFL